MIGAANTATKAGKTGRNREAHLTLPKLEVAGSNPVSRSTDLQGFMWFPHKPFIFALQPSYNKARFLKQTTPT